MRKIMKPIFTKSNFRASITTHAMFAIHVCIKSLLDCIWCRRCAIRTTSTQEQANILIVPDTTSAEASPVSVARCEELTFKVISSCSKVFKDILWKASMLRVLYNFRI